MKNLIMISQMVISELKVQIDSNIHLRLIKAFSKLFYQLMKIKASEPRL